MKRLQVTCMECGKKESFVDVKDISYAKWHIIRWIMATGEPGCVCKDCDYIPVETINKKENKNP